MRNLRNIFLEEIELHEDLPLTATSWDAASDSTICAFGPSATKSVIELKRRVVSQSNGHAPGDKSRQLFVPITSWDAPCLLPDLVCDEILLLHYFSDIATACIVLAGGDLVVIREEPQAGEERIEIVGSVDVGIAAAAWAYDEEVLAIVTRADTLVLMSRDFEPVTETTLSADDLNASKHVSVGWGKKETQFKGKRAKALRDPTMPETVDDGKLSPKDDGRTTISWRGDGAFFAVNGIIPDKRRVIRVYTREGGVLDSASEPVDGLESALSWKPTGSLLAAVQRFEDRIDVIFFERNGLRHGQFSLRLTKEDLESWASNISLSWSADSSVLAVMFKDRVQLWTTGNYHYYLKQEIRSSRITVRCQRTAFRWHPETPLRCSMICTTSLLTLEYAFFISRGSTIRPYDHGIVAVIDGHNLKLTPLKHATVPPPMAFCDIVVQDNIIDCSFNDSGSRIAVLTTTSVEVYEWNLTPKPSAIIHGIMSCSLYEEGNQSPAPRFTQISAFRGGDALVLGHLPFPAQKCLKHLSLDSAQKYDEGRKHLKLIGSNISGSHPLLVTDVSRQELWCRDESAISAIGSDGHMHESIRTYSSPGNRPWVDVLQLDSNEESDRLANGSGAATTFCTISLSKQGELYANERLLAHGCTSYVVTRAHLVFTTSQHFLKFVHITREQDWDIPADTPEVDERCRSIERGAKIVTVTPSTYAVTLQMPRGNLETIFPRALVLAGIRQHIDDRDYKSAFMACQSHQVDTNILYDYNPQLFMTNIPLFVEQLKKVSRVDEFISKLKEEDVTQTLYRDTLKVDTNRNPKPNAPSNQQAGDAVGIIASTGKGQSKVNQICDAFLAFLEPRISRHMQNLVTAHVCKRPPDLIAGLQLVADCRRKDAGQAETALEHLCFLSDPVRLFDTALALYDLDLTLLVAQQSQRDPREYMPFLQRLHTLPEMRRRFEIDNHLRNYTKALESLHTLSVHDEVESYTVKHNLYPTAMALYKYDNAHLSAITALYASYLHSKSRYADAAMIFESLGDFASAYPAYALAHLWREALTCAALVPVPAEELIVLAQSLATTCAEEARDYRSAATIHSEYLSDVPGGARLLCKGSYFSEASRILALHGLKDMMPDILDPGLAEKFGEITELVADCKGQLNAQVPRIKELGLKRLVDPLAFFGGDAAATDGQADIPDNVSLAPTDASTTGGQSLFTRYGGKSKFGGTVASNVSRKTSKTRRREERKRASGKKGSVYEEEYLVNSVGRLIDRVNSLQNEIRRLIEGLLRRGMRERAAAVDEAMKETSDLCHVARKEIWTVEKDGVMDSEQYHINGEGRPPGADGVYWDSQMKAQARREPPEVKEWRSGGLLDQAAI